MFNADCDVANSDFINSISTATTTSLGLTNFSPMELFIQRSSIMIMAPIPNITCFPPSSNSKKETESPSRIPAQGSTTSLKVSTPWPHFLSYWSDLLNKIGEIQYEDTADPGTPHKLGPGAVLHVDQDSVLHWHTPSVAKGQCYFECFLPLTHLLLNRLCCLPCPGVCQRVRDLRRL